MLGLVWQTCPRSTNTQHHISHSPQQQREINGSPILNGSQTDNPTTLTIGIIFVVFGIIFCAFGNVGFANETVNLEKCELEFENINVNADFKYNFDYLFNGYYPTTYPTPVPRPTKFDLLIHVLDYVKLIF